MKMKMDGSRHHLTEGLRREQSLALLKYEYYKKSLQEELNSYKQIRVPTKNFSISNEEFVEWSIELLSPTELYEVVTMIRNAKSRSSNVRPILETIAIGIVNKQYT